MMLTLTASIMYWHSKKPSDEKSTTLDSDSASSSNIDDSGSESSTGKKMVLSHFPKKST